MTEILQLAIVLVEVAFIAGTLWYQQRLTHNGYKLRNLVMMALINLALIATCGSKLVLSFGVETNVGNVFFAIIILVQAIIVHRWGMAIALDNIMRLIAGLMLFYILGQIVKNMPEVPGNEASARAIGVIFSISARLGVASLLGLLVSAQVFALLYGRLSDSFGVVTKYLLSAFACFAVDNTIFFSITFHGVIPIDEIAIVALGGFAIKCGVAVLTAPVVVLAARYDAELETRAGAH